MRSHVCSPASQEPDVADGDREPVARADDAGRAGGAAELGRDRVVGRDLSREVPFEEAEDLVRGLVPVGSPALATDGAGLDQRRAFAHPQPPPTTPATTTSTASAAARRWRFVIGQPARRQRRWAGAWVACRQRT